MYRAAKRENESAPVRIEGNRFGIAPVLASARAVERLFATEMSVVEIFVNTSVKGWYGTPAD